MVAIGALRPGDRLPSVRELAEFSGSNVNTARAAYATLEAEGVLDTQHGRGTFVAESAASPPGLGEAIERSMEAAADAGATPAELLAGLYARSVAAPGADEAALRRALRAQIAHLERELAGYAWEERREPAPKGPETALPTGVVAGAEELERTRDGLLERLAALRAGAESRGLSEQVARTRRAKMEADPAAHPWEVVTAVDAGEPGRSEWQVVPRFGPLGAIMGWWRVRVTPSSDEG